MYKILIIKLTIPYWIFKILSDLFLSGSYHGVVGKMLASNVLVFVFVHQSCNYFNFRTNTLGKGIERHCPSTYGLNNIFGIK